MVAGGDGTVAVLPPNARCGSPSCPDSPLLIDEALDQLSVLQMGEGDLFAAAATIDRRLEILAAVPVDALSGFEHYDSLHMACQLNLAMGRLEPARRFADAITALPFFRQERHLGLGRRLGVDALAGDFAAAVVTRRALRAGLASDGTAGRRQPRGRRLRGRHGVRNARRPGGSRPLDRHHREHCSQRPERLHTVYNVWRVVFDGLLALHRDDLAWRRRVALRPSRRCGPAGRTTAHPLWESWYAAAWAETGVLTGDPDAMSRVLVTRRELCRANEIALAIVDRAAALHEGRIGDLDPIIGRLTHPRMQLPG